MNQNPGLDLTVRLGCELIYETWERTPAYMVVRPRRRRLQRIQQEMFVLEPDLDATEEIDTHGNLVDRVLLKPGLNTIRHDALVAVTSQHEVLPYNEPAEHVDKLPLSLLRYTLPSRYCDSDKLMNFAAEHFGSCAPGAPTVRAICDWLHNNIEYRYGSGCPDISASEIIARGYGVCRDFAHTAVALCRTFNIPTRYVTGHLPDIAFQDPGTAMDFHAYMEVYLGGEWHTFDARFNTPRVGRVKIACGMDAVDGAFTTVYGSAVLRNFTVWAYQVDQAKVSIGDPIDLSFRLDGTPLIRWPEKTQTVGATPMA
jgi:transglutaminase-like putative cysteine protease